MYLMSHSKFCLHTTNIFLEEALEVHMNGSKTSFG